MDTAAEEQENLTFFQKLKRKTNPSKYRHQPKVKIAPRSNLSFKFEKEIDNLAHMPEGSIRKKDKKLKKLFKKYLAYLSKFRPNDPAIFKVLEKMKSLDLLPVSLDLTTKNKKNNPQEPAKQ